MSLAHDVRALALSPRSDVVDALAQTARDRAHDVGLDQAVRAAIEVAYDIGRAAVVQELFVRTLRREQERVGGVLQ